MAPLKSIARVTTMVLATPLPAAAQASRHAFDDLGRYLEGGDAIHVVTKTEGQVSGELAALTPASVVVRKADGTTREVASGEVGWIDRVPDRWWDGAVGGAVGG